ncbi:hypothetical protein J1605_022343 [Eschrichtius robustus]|uniref:Protein kinase C-binding protein NELL2 n=1 Tax=Eschrichtius robustus TaxID=9764 RepID=A0AB34HBZ9_ESCRO|nr:hypothetical protein J1605_022343 [Eschrichtius robustus]
MLALSPLIGSVTGIVVSRDCTAVLDRASSLLCGCHSPVRDVDECAEGRHYCRENTMCVNTPGSFMCICKTGYIRIDDYSCTGKQ